tara:strand:- start:210 stop:380 length:171 start_codon:yes stop_codon:yes gene_type:complete
MTYIWVKFEGELNWEPHLEFDEKNDENRGTTIMTDAAAEIDDLKSQGHKAKRGPAW